MVVRLGPLWQRPFFVTSVVTKLVASLGHRLANFPSVSSMPVARRFTDVIRLEEINTLLPLSRSFKEGRYAQVVLTLFCLYVVMTLIARTLNSRIRLVTLVLPRIRSKSQREAEVNAAVTSPLVKLLIPLTLSLPCMVKVLTLFRTLRS